MGKPSRQTKLDLNRIYGLNKIICKNKIIVGDKFYAMFLTFFIFTIPYLLSIIFFLKSGPLELYQNIIYIIILSLLYIIHIYSMIKGGCSDPGILPRQNKDLYYETNKTNMKYRISGHIQRVNYCYSCYLFRPPRTSHCAICDNCVERFDHHCLWLGTCIGKRNYKYFYSLLGSLNINAIFQIIYCIIALNLEVKRIKDKENKGYSFIIIIGCIILYNLLFLIIFIGKLFILHTYLVFKGMTFYEYTKEKLKIYPEGMNIYDKYKLFSNKCILFRKNEKSLLLDAVSKHEKNSFIQFKKYKKSKKKLIKEDIIKFTKEKNEAINMSNTCEKKVTIRYLKTYQEYPTIKLKKKTFGNNINIRKDKKKFTDENNHINSSNRKIGNITFDFNGILNNQQNKLKNFVSSSESSKEIDFDNNVNIVINPYCNYPENNNNKQQKNNNRNNTINILQKKNSIVKRNESIGENILNEVHKKHKKIMFSNL